MCCNIFLTFDFIPAAQLPSCPSLGQPGLMPRLPQRCLGCSSAAHGTFNARRQGGVEGNVAAATSHTCAPRRICVPCHGHCTTGAVVLAPRQSQPTVALLQGCFRAVACCTILQCLIYLCAKLISESTPSLTILFHCLLLHFKIATIMQLSHCLCLITEALNFYRVSVIIFSHFCNDQN